MLFIHHKQDGEHEAMPPEKLKRFAGRMRLSIDLSQLRRFFVLAADLQPHKEPQALAAPDGCTNYWEVVVEDEDL